LTRQSEIKREAAPKRGGDRLVPQKPRDCGPHVDTWPILDEPVGAAPDTKTGQQGRHKKT